MNNQNNCYEGRILNQAINEMKNNKCQRYIQGPTGPTGPAGTGTIIVGSYDSIQDLEILHPIGNPNEAYVVNGDLYVWSAKLNEWMDVGTIKGATGPLAHKA